MFRRTLQLLLRRWLLRLLQGRMAHRVISCRVFIAFGSVSLENAIGTCPWKDPSLHSYRLQNRSTRNAPEHTLNLGTA